MIKVTDLRKSFSSHIKEPGLKGSIKALVKRKSVTKDALKSVSLEIKQGEIVGLIGANGAGKTTLVKILAGIVHPTSGEATVLGFRPWERNNEYRKQMSLIMGQKAQVWWDLPALDSFILLKEIYQIEDSLYKYNLEFLADTLMIKNQLKTQVRKLSLGERMKVELMAALLHNPKVIFLDEPTIGLDISAQKAVREFMKNYQREFKPITILTSHYMEDIKELCPRIVIIKEGEFVYDGALSQVQRMLGDEKCLTVTTKEKTFKVNVPRAELAQKTSDIFHQNEVLDLNIHDPSIEDIIESIMKKRNANNMNWWRFVVAAEYRKIFAFRADFWVTFIGQTMVQLFIARALWQNIFEASGNSVMEGYTLPMMTLYYLIVPIGNRMLQGENVGFLSREIYDGSFNRYLIYPISFFQYKTLTYLSYSFFYGMQLILVFLLYKGFITADLTLDHVFYLGIGLGLFLMASYTYCMLSIFVELISLWADNIWSLMVMCRFFCYFFGGSFVPLAFMPQWLQKSLVYTPFPYLVSLPVRTTMGLTTWQEIGTGFAFLFFWSFILRQSAKALWNKGQYRYTGVGI